MKKILSLIAAVLLFTGLTVINVSAQCPGCLINASCLPPGGGLCPDSLPAATVAVPYDEDVTFYLPPSVSSPIGVVPLLEVHIDAVSGLPFGIGWTADQPSNTYYLGGAGGHGCVKLCGTPIGTPGVYNITVSVTATVDAGILGNQTGNQSFYMQMVLLPGSASNVGFTLSPPVGCEPLVVSFENNNPSGGWSTPYPAHYGGFDYHWDFGNGNQSNIEDPTSQLYVAAGSFPVTYSLIVDTFGFVLKNFQILAANCTDFGSSQDLELKIYDNTNTQIFYYDYADNTVAASLPSVLVNLQVNPAKWPYRIEIWDQDSWPSAPNDNCWDDTENGYPAGQCALTLPPVNAYGPTTYVFNSGTGLSFSYTFEKIILEIEATDTIIVNPLPPVNPIGASADAVCSGDSILLTTTPGYSYEWFLNDTIALPGDTSAFWARVQGSYSVRLIDPLTGCFSWMPDTMLTFYTAIPGSFAITVNAVNGNLQSNISGTYNYQWQIFSGATWVNIPAPAGLQSFLSPPANGQYRLIASNSNGCTDTAAAFTFSTFGIEDQHIVSEVVLYPNPTTGSFMLDMKEVNAENVNISIINMVGQTVYNKEFEVSGGSFVQSFDIYNLANGIYTVDIRIGNVSIRKKLIKE